MESLKACISYKKGQLKEKIDQRVNKHQRDFYMTPHVSAEVLLRSDLPREMSASGLLPQYASFLFRKYRL